MIHTETCSTFRDVSCFYISVNAIFEGIYEAVFGKLTSGTSKEKACEVACVLSTNLPAVFVFIAPCKCEVYTVFKNDLFFYFGHGSSPSS